MKRKTEDSYTISCIDCPKFNSHHIHHTHYWRGREAEQEHASERGRVCCHGGKAMVIPVELEGHEKVLLQVENEEESEVCVKKLASKTSKISLA